MSENSPPGSPGNNRRASFAPGQRISELFRQSAQTGSSPPHNSNGNGNGSNANPNSPPPAYPGPIATAAAQANQRRRMSISALGLSGSPTAQTSPGVGMFAGRRGSMSSNGTSPSTGTSPGGASTGSAEESAVEDGDSSGNNPMGFAKRMSFGARAMRSASNGGSNAPPLRSHAGEHADKSFGPGAASTSPPKAGWTRSIGRGEGFNWSESFRTRTERSASITNNGLSTSPRQQPPNHPKAASVATVTPVKEPPKRNVPDHFQERILKGDFYMD